MQASGFDHFIENAIAEDIGDGDHTSLACIPENAKGSAGLLIKENGIIAGLELAALIMKKIDSESKFTALVEDGDAVEIGQTAFTVSGKVRKILLAERLILNCMQRMSGIATETAKYVERIRTYRAKILDTRKTSPNSRIIEKWAVRIGGGSNHRMGLHDMILIKDNHVDYAGSITEAVKRSREYLKVHQKNLKIEVETRNLDEVKEALATGAVDRIMLDNFIPSMMLEAVTLIDAKVETEASGGITLETISDYAATGVDFISVGALTHSFKSLDLSLKAIE